MCAQEPSSVYDGETGSQQQSEIVVGRRRRESRRRGHILYQLLPWLLEPAPL
jgi:hypothetical protein